MCIFPVMVCRRRRSVITSTCSNLKVLRAKVVELGLIQTCRFNGLSVEVSSRLSCKIWTLITKGEVGHSQLLSRLVVNFLFHWFSDKVRFGNGLSLYAFLAEMKIRLLNLLAKSFCFLGRPLLWLFLFEVTFWLWFHLLLLSISQRKVCWPQISFRFLI